MRWRWWPAGWESQWAERWRTVWCKWAWIQSEDAWSSCRRSWGVVESTVHLPQGFSLSEREDKKLPSYFNSFSEALCHAMPCYLFFLHISPPSFSLVNFFLPSSDWIFNWTFIITYTFSVPIQLFIDSEKCLNASVPFFRSIFKCQNIQSLSWVCVSTERETSTDSSYRLTKMKYKPTFKVHREENQPKEVKPPATLVV